MVVRTAPNVPWQNPFGACRRRPNSRPSCLPGHGGGGICWVARTSGLLGRLLGIRNNEHWAWWALSCSIFRFRSQTDPRYACPFELVEADLAFGSDFRLYERGLGRGRLTSELFEGRGPLCSIRPTPGHRAHERPAEGGLEPYPSAWRMGYSRLDVVLP